MSLNQFSDNTFQTTWILLLAAFLVIKVFENIYIYNANIGVYVYNYYLVQNYIKLFGIIQ